jgi:hypothetical protein
MGADLDQSFYELSWYRLFSECPDGSPRQEEGPHDVRGDFNVWPLLELVSGQFSMNNSTCGAKSNAVAAALAMVEISHLRRMAAIRGRDHHKDAGRAFVGTEPASRTFFRVYFYHMSPFSVWLPFPALSRARVRSYPLTFFCNSTVAVCTIA